MINQCSSCGGFCKKSGCERENVKPTPQRTWVGLTNDEVNNFAAGCHLGKTVQGSYLRSRSQTQGEKQWVIWLNSLMIKAREQE